MVWSNLNHFFVHQPATMNFMHLQSSHTPHSQHLQSDPHLESVRRTVVGLFGRSSVSLKTVGCFCRGAPSLMFDRILSVTVSEEKASTSGVTHGNLELLLRPNFPDSHQRWHLGLTQRPHFYKEELIQLGDKSKNVSLIFVQLPIKANGEMLPSCFRILAEAKNTKILTKNHPDF